MAEYFPCGACGRHYNATSSRCDHCGAPAGPPEEQKRYAERHAYNPPPVVYGGPGMMARVPRRFPWAAVLGVLAALGVAAWLLVRWLRA